MPSGISIGEAKDVAQGLEVNLYREIHSEGKSDFLDCKDYWNGVFVGIIDSQIENKNEIKNLTNEEKEKVKQETSWSDKIIDSIKNMAQYEILKNAGLVEAEINGRKCLIREDIDLDYTDEDGVSNRDRISRGLAPLDSKTEKPIELHHLGQKADSPLVELTEEEHRTGEYEDGKKNQSLWHDNTMKSEVHGEGNSWDQERTAHWKARNESSEE